MNSKSFDVSDPRTPTLVLTDRHLGLFYTFPIVPGLFEDRYACCLWHATGYRWYDLYGGPKPVYSGDHWPSEPTSPTAWLFSGKKPWRSFAASTRSSAVLSSAAGSLARLRSERPSAQRTAHDRWRHVVSH